MQVGGGLTALILFTVLGLLWAREYRNHKKSKATPTELAEAV